MFRYLRVNVSAVGRQGAVGVVVVDVVVVGVVVHVVAVVVGVAVGVVVVVAVVVDVEETVDLLVRVHTPVFVAARSSHQTCQR